MFVFFSNINLIQMGLLTDGGSRQKALVPIIFHTSYNDKLGKVIPYSKKIQKIMNHITHPLSSANIGNKQILLYQEVLFTFLSL